jgi:hypothetical protein
MERRERCSNAAERFERSVASADRAIAACRSGLPVSMKTAAQCSDGAVLLAEKRFGETEAVKCVGIAMLLQRIQSSIRTF